MQKVKPLGNKIAVELEDFEAETRRRDSVIVVPRSVSSRNERERYFLVGVVVGVGSGRRASTGDLVAPQASVGDRVTFSARAHTVEIQGQDTGPRVVIVDADEIDAVLEPEE